MGAMEEEQKSGLVSRRTLLLGAGAGAVLGAGGLLVPLGASAASLSARGIQKSLYGLYYYDGVIDGVLGSMTKSATRRFQSDRGLVVDGYAGAVTQNELVSMVKKVQGRVGTTQDGDYGSVTISKVKSFQRRWGGLVVDGRAGAKTMTALKISRTASGGGGGGGGGGSEPPAGNVNGAISRSQVIARAKYWSSNPRPYSMSKYSKGPSTSLTWRTDCSGFVSMAWNLRHKANPTGLTTYSLHPSAGYGVTKAISKSQLQAGDILLITPAENGKSYGHVVIFEKWANAAKTRYICIEQAPSQTKRREVAYPYDSANGSKYKPYRYNKIS